MRPRLPLPTAFALFFLPAVFALTVSIAPSASAQITSHFDAGTEGWTVVSYPFRSHVASPATSAATLDGAFGNPAGSLRVGDVFPETGFAAPPAFLGDKSAAYGGSFAYDLLIRFTDGVVYPAVVLNGGSLSLYYDAPSPVLNVWERRVVPLVETGWRVSGGTTPATSAQMKAVLANLQGIYVYTEWHSGPDDTSFDNPTLTATAPVPSSGWLGGPALVLALLGAAHRGARRRVTP